MTLLGISGLRPSFSTLLGPKRPVFSGRGAYSEDDRREEERLTREDRTPRGMLAGDTFWPSSEPVKPDAVARLSGQADKWMDIALEQFQDKPKRALLHLQKALEVAELAEGGEKSVLAAVAQSCIGWVYAQNDKPEEAFNYYSRALERYNKMDPKTVPAWRPASVYGMLASLMKQHQNWEQGEAYIIDGLKWLQKGQDAPQNAATHVDLLGHMTRLKIAQDDAKGALTYAERGVEQAGLLPEATNTNYYRANALYLAGWAYAHTKQPGIGLPLMEAGILVKKKQSGKTSPSLIPYLSLYGDMLEATQNYAKADRIRREADAIREANDLALNGDDDPNPLNDD